MTRVNLQFCQTNLTVVRNGGLTALVIAFDMALTENEFGPKKVDRNDDLTALMIWPEGESTVVWTCAGTTNSLRTGTQDSGKAILYSLPVGTTAAHSFTDKSHMFSIS